MRWACKMPMKRSPIIGPALITTIIEVASLRIF
jgi:hypothetical protein